MFQFHAGEDGVLDYEVSFASHPYANLSLFDAARQDILLHVSLRRDQGVAVFNRRIDGLWQVERPRPWAPTAERLRFRLVVEGGRARITAEDALVFDLGPKDVPGLAGVAWQDVQGGFVTASIGLSGQRNAARVAAGGLSFVAPFSLEGWGVDRAVLAQDLRLHLPDLRDPPRVVAFARPDLAQDQGLTAVPLGVELPLPGRVWAELGPEAPLVARLEVNGRACGPSLLVRRQDVAEGITRLALHGPGPVPTEWVALAVEHVRFGGIWPLLPAPAQRWLSREAGRCRLQSFLPPAEMGDAATAFAAGPDAAELAAEVAASRLFAAFRAAGPGARVADFLGQLADAPPEARGQLALILTDRFCAEGAFDALAAWAEDRGLPPPRPAGDAHGIAQRLPWQFRHGQWLDLTQGLERLAGDRAGWLATAPLAWLVGRLAAGADAPPCPPDRRGALLGQCLAVMRARGESYWGRGQCRYLQRAALELLAAAPRLPRDLAQEIRAHALAVQGLVPGFWQDFDAALAQGRPVAADPAFGAARQAFGIVQRAVVAGLRPAAPGGPTLAEFQAALDLFDLAGNIDAPRFRREVLGVWGGADPGQGADALLAALLATPEREAPGTRLMRALAFPATPEALPAAEALRLAPLVRQAVAEAHHPVPQGPQLALQRATVGRIWAILSGEAALAAQTPGLLGDLAQLTGEGEAGLGAALALALAEGLLSQGRAAEAQAWLAALRPWLGKLAPGHGTAPWPLAVARALDRLAARHAGQPDIAACLQDMGHPGAPGAGAGAGAAAALTAPPLFDALVLVISCRAYLESRIPVIERAWAHRLDGLGIPWLAVVGGAEGPARREGRVLHLPVPDDYEGLPQKVMAAFDWARTQADVGHVLKIDDDCFLDVEAFFHGQSWRKHDYYGRVLTRVPGQLDRAWHQAKSQSPRGRMQFDLSPEPAVFADGGSGYVLSARAVEALRAEAATRAGARLVQGAFLEDKLVGDLLAQAGIELAEEDHLVAVRRRSGKGDLTTSIWSNSFLPSAASGVVVAHLDAMPAIEAAAALLPRAELFPKKVWPSAAPPKLIYNSNALELISPAAKLHRLNQAPLAVVTTLRNEILMLPHFLAHYRALGVEAFLIGDNLSDDGSLELLEAQPDVVTFSMDSEFRASDHGIVWHQALMANFRVGRWSLVADADEFLLTGRAAQAPLGEVLAGPGFAEADAVRVFMLDLYPKGPLATADFRDGPFAQADHCDAEPFRADSGSLGPFGDQPQWTSALRHRLMPGSRPELFTAQKVPLLKYRPWMRLTSGSHAVGGARLADRELLFAHFKYHAQFHAKAQAEVARGQHFNDAEEYRRYLMVLQEGRDVLYDPAHSVPWQGCATVRRILG